VSRFTSSPVRQLQKPLMPPTSAKEATHHRSSSDRCLEISRACRWIWIPGEEAPVNAFVDFQGRFQLRDIPPEVRVLISADSRYRLHVNGHPIGIGPARNYPHYYEFDCHDVTHLLKLGGNVLDVRVHHWGEGTFHGLVLRAGLICEVQSGEAVLLSTSRFWRARPAAAYQFPTPRIACQLGFEEQVDLGLEEGAIDGRIATGKGWVAAVEIGAAGISPWGPLTLRTIPLLGGDTASPVSVRECGDMKNGELVLSLRAGPDLGCDWKAANSERVDGVFASRFFAKRGGTVRVRRSAMYGGPIRVFVDGREVVLLQGRFDLEGDVLIRSGEHLVLVEWKGDTHDTDVGISLSGVEGLQTTSFEEFPGARWIFAFPQKWRARIRQATSPESLMRCGAAWTPVSADHAPAHDVYMALSTRDPARNALPVDRMLPLRIAPRPDHCPRRVVLDFGAQCFGWIEMEMIAGEGSVVELMGIEARGDAGPQLTEMTNNTARIVCRQGRQIFQSFVARGFRYLILDIVARETDFELLNARVKEETYPWKPQGRFL